MKNSIKILTLLFTFLIFTSLSFASSNINVTINGVEVNFPDAKPFIDADAGRTMIPVRFVAEDLESEVEWNAEDRIVYINKGDNNIQLTIDSKIAIVNDEPIELDTEAIIHEDRTYVPLRFVSEQLGADVDWDNKTKTVIINSKNNNTLQEEEEEVIISKDNIKLEKNENFTEPENFIQMLPEDKPKQTVDGITIYYFNEAGEYDNNGMPYVNLSSVIQRYNDLSTKPNTNKGIDLYYKEDIILIKNLEIKSINLNDRMTLEYYMNNIYPLTKGD